jgi:ABC-2 type transport system permease protein
MTAPAISAPALPSAPGSHIGQLAHDTWLVFQRHVLLQLRSPIFIVFGLGQPVTYVLLFAPMLRLALKAEGVTSYEQAYQIYVPGLLTVMAILGGAYSGFGLLRELRSGIVERARVTPVSRLSLMLGRALREVTMMVFQAVLVTLLALPFGLRVPIGDLLLAYLIVALLSLMSVMFAYGLTLSVRSEATLGPMINTIGQPVMLLAGVLLPLTLAPLWLLDIARWNPFYWATNAMRALFQGHAGANSVWITLVLISALAVVTTTWAVRVFSRLVK